MCQEFGLENSAIQTIGITEPKLLVRLIRTHREKCDVLKSGRSDDDKIMLKGIKQEKSDNAPLSGPLLLISFVRPKFKFS